MSARSGGVDVGTIDAVSAFNEVEPTWAARLGTLRNVVRQHLIRAQLNEHLEGVVSVLDVGCGQGTQALELAARGCQVTGVDPSVDLLARARADASRRGCSIELLQGGIDDLDELAPGRLFDLVSAHGLLMYLPDARTAVRELAARVAPRGLLSFTARNGDALAYRPGIRGEWDAALRAFDAESYTNELGARATAHRLDEVLGWCGELGLEVLGWYGVRVLTDGVDPEQMPNPDTLASCLEAEESAGRRDPYRRMASQIHVIARRISQR